MNRTLHQGELNVKNGWILRCLGPCPPPAYASTAGQMHGGRSAATLFHNVLPIIALQYEKLDVGVEGQTP